MNLPWTMTKEHDADEGHNWIVWDDQGEEVASVHVLNHDDPKKFEAVAKFIVESVNRSGVVSNAPPSVELTFDPDNYPVY